MRNTASKKGSTEPTSRDIKHLNPPEWGLDAYSWQKIRSGMSGAYVARLDHESKRSLFLKSDEANEFSEVAAEAQRLRWLNSVGVRCPSVVKFATHAGRNWLLTKALLGYPMNRALPR